MRIPSFSTAIFVAIETTNIHCTFFIASGENLARSVRNWHLRASGPTATYWKILACCKYAGIPPPQIRIYSRISIHYSDFTVAAPATRLCGAVPAFQLGQDAGRAELARLWRWCGSVRPNPGGAIEPEKRFNLEAGLVVQSIILRNAWSSGSGSGNDAVATCLSDDTHGAALEMMGVDLRQTPLYGLHSPLSPSF
jgi:hypothetical protein